MSAVEKFCKSRQLNQAIVTFECGLCGKAVRDSENSTGNFNRHIKRMHSNDSEYRIVEQHLSSINSRIEMRIKALLEEQSLTCKNNTHIIAFTGAVYWNSELHSVLLSFRRLHKANTLSHVAAIIEDELQRLKIHEEVNFIITDNASYLVRGLQNQQILSDTESSSSESEWESDEDVSLRLVSRFFRQRFLHSLELA
ncbi:hypothetical protein Ciccas_014612 [Cichlidogyrus casuarinus]|uniref:BED-type domain-containing protein n=1 Tax=Cichlidogyrus casuarinus TaxID=1844966 RepID=A0ABD2PJE5_9PLAT